jgi:hypothetical protein
MLRLLLFMHHIALYTPCFTYFNVVHLLHIRVDHAKPKMEIQVEQAPVHPTKVLVFYV